MTSAELESAIAKKGHARYRELTSDANPDAWQRELYRAEVVRIAAGDKPASPEYPSLLEMAGNLAKSAVAYVASGCENVDQAEYDRRRSICDACESYDAERVACKECGCPLRFKPWGKAMECPLEKWSRDHAES